MFPYPQRIYFPMFLDYINMFAFLLPLRTYRMVRDDTGWVLRDVNKTREEVSRTQIERENDTFLFFDHHHPTTTVVSAGTSRRRRAEYHIRGLPGVRTSLPTSRTYRRSLAQSRGRRGFVPLGHFPFFSPTRTRGSRP